MAEVANIVAGVFQLIPLCNAGFVLIKDVVQLEQKLSEQRIRIQNHQNNFRSWCEIWGPSETQERKFKHYAQDNPVSAKAVLRQLALNSRLFFDIKGLDRYGFEIKKLMPTDHRIQHLDDFHFETNADLDPQNINRFEAKCNTNLLVMRRIQFSLVSGGKGVDELIARFREFNEVLWGYGQPLELARLNKGIYDNLHQLTGDQLNKLLAAYTRESETSRDSVSAGNYRSLAKMVNLRAHAIQGAPGRPHVFGASSFHMTDNYRVDSRGTSTMALLYDYPKKGDHRVALIEWAQNAQVSGKRREIEKLALLLNVPKPDEMSMLDSYGILDDLQRTNRLGLVLKPPINIRTNLPQPLPPGAISERRMPINLRQLIKTRDGLDLSVRFDIAKKLVDAVHMMHAVDWAHKNIRPNNILFFPLGSIGDESSTQAAHRVFDLLSPFITGYSNGAASGINLKLDYYEHPARRNDPQIAYRRLYDLYSLGCVLLELALWTTIDKQIEHDPGSREASYKVIRALSLKPTLDRMVGKIFADVIRDCIALGERSSLDNPAKFGTDIASRLAQCVA
ncbi:Putative protein of unknown function [Podospora comata]|uniref:Protein kinase domain-containing protein n=1 Tax=Podospora comata TaxID=48703 RepID=A0ABY6S7T5_PODCO|nr:Putative protein of unknown function [Podospora comata]